MSYAVHEQVPGTDQHDRGVNMGTFIGEMHQHRPLSGQPHVDALDAAVSAVFVMGTAGRYPLDAAKIDALVRGVVEGVNTAFAVETGGES